MLLALAVALVAAPPAPSLADTLKALQAHETVTARFEQVKTLKAFKEPQKAEGRLLIRPPRQLRWEYTAPYQAILVLRGDKASMSYPDLGRKQTWDLSKDPSLKAVIDSILFFLESDPDAVRRRYEVTLDGDRLTLVPRGKKARQLLARIEAVIDRKRGVLSAITLVEPDGDSTRLTLTDIQVDQPIDDALLRP